MRVYIVTLLATLALSAQASPADLWRAILAPEALYAPTENIPALATTLNLTTLVDFVKKAGLAGILSGQGPFTVFGPNNDAFAKLPPALVDLLTKNISLLAEVLEYHVISGDVYSTQLQNDELAPSLLRNADIRINLYGKIVTASGRKIIQVDQNATNGVIHVLDGVMLPPAGTVTQLVQETPQAFSTLLKAVVVAKLADTLNSPGPFTVFAPTNDAFAKLPAGALDKLLADPKALENVLLYHVVAGTYYSAGLTSGEVPTENKQKVKVTVNQNGVMVNNANVIEADVTVTNGVVHVIDTVLLPPSFYEEHSQYRMQLIKKLNKYQIL